VLGPYKNAELHNSAECGEFLVLFSGHQLLEKDHVPIVTSPFQISLGSSGFEGYITENLT
jgi:hypothetical protein